MTVPVLVVDDDTEFLDVLQASIALVAPQFRLYTASTAAEALTFLRGAGLSVPRPAFIVLDYHLGEREAPGLLGEIRAVDAQRDIPVLVISQFAWERDARAARDAGAAQFSVKPSRARDLGKLLLEFWEGYVDGCEGPVDRG